MTHNAVGVVTHVDRMERGGELADMVEAKVMSLDPGRLGAKANHLKCWQELYETFPNSNWLIVLEDDAQPVTDFRRELRYALTVSPEPILSLYLGRTRPGWWQPSLARAFGLIDRTLDENAPDPCFFTGPSLLHCVAVAIRTSLVPLMADAVSQSGATTPVDEAISEWAEKRKLGVAYTNPSLVDHDDSLPTLITTRESRYGDQSLDTGDRTFGTRRAWNVGTRKTWTKTSFVIPPPEMIHANLIVR